MENYCINFVCYEGITLQQENETLSFLSFHEDTFIGGRNYMFDGRVRYLVY